MSRQQRYTHREYLDGQELILSHGAIREPIPPF